MRALTVRQPWAWAIVHGGKDVENRSRNLAGSYRGPVAIHAGLAPFEKGTAAGALHKEMHGGDVPTDLVFGGVIGVVDLIDVHHDHDTDECMGGGLTDSGLYLSCSPWAMAGQHHLVLANARPLTRPIPAKGRLGLWTPDQDLVDAIREQANG